MRSRKFNQLIVSYYHLVVDLRYLLIRVVSTMDPNVRNVDYDIMQSYEIQSGFIGLGEFLEKRGAIHLIRGESCRAE